jgi:hypothetical protein
MIRLTPDAQIYLDEYLADIRSAVAGHASLSPDEIEQDVRDHVFAALEDVRGPVSASQLAAVLDRLGPPNEWVADEPRSIWKYLTDKLKPVGHRAVGQIKALPGDAYQAGRGIAARVRGISHDWRLAYVAFGLFAFGMIAFPLFPAFLIASYFAARAQVSLARERGEPLGARKWLVYPPMVIVSIVLLIVLALWPLAPAAGIVEQIPRKLRPEAAEIMHVSPRVVEQVATTYMAVGFISMWWCILSLIVLRFPNVPTALLPPFGAKFRRIDALLVLLLSATVLVCWLSKAETAWRVAQEVLWRM